ncbi:MAG TPA: pantoate--beta-alanine ligase [Candidatus Dormibacteraeota bacterium]|jgi:pantoate--beta-alanine ligase|nr:pantoate--beta-alanine ligase [Candidatus Dormibacteraeota bacterium]
MATPAPPPRVLRTPADLRLQSERWGAAGLTVGLVPTMGALHEGHRSLLARARVECDRVVASIFVNPTQFGAGEDLSRYPRPLERDLAMLQAERIDAAFVPATEAMYPEGVATTVHVGGPLTEGFEGAARPGHFDGVATVVTKLLVAARPGRAYFGDKDAQQLAVVERLAADLDTGVQIVACPLVRDPDGLALSSRNAYLSAEERRQALAIPAGLAAAARLYDSGEADATRLLDAVRDRLSRSPDLAVDYVAVVDPQTFAELRQAGRGCRIVLAGRMGRTRLIDTFRLGIDEVPAVAEGPAEAAQRSNTAPGASEWSRSCSVS